MGRGPGAHVPGRGRDPGREPPRRGHHPPLPGAGGMAAALGGREAVLDGEVVALDEEGRPSFQTLQLRMGLSRPETIRRRATEVPVTYVAFDLLALDGEALLTEPYERRRELLAGLGLRGRPVAGAGAPRRRRRGVPRGGPRPGPRGDRLQAARQRLPARRPQPRLAEDPGAPRPGARDRRLHARRGRAVRAGGLAARGLLGRDPGGGRAPRPAPAAGLRGRGRHGLHRCDARAADRPARARSRFPTRRSSWARTPA